MGMGKTFLVLECAHRLQDNVHNDRHFVFVCGSDVGCALEDLNWFGAAVRRLENVPVVEEHNARKLFDEHTRPWLEAREDCSSCWTTCGRRMRSSS
jgi:hypothetical protein